MNYLIPLLCLVVGFAIGYLVGKMKKPKEPEIKLPEYKKRDGPNPPDNKEHPPRP